MADRTVYLLVANRGRLVAAQTKATKLLTEAAAVQAEVLALLGQQDALLAALNDGKLENVKPGSKGGKLGGRTAEERAAAKVAKEKAAEKAKAERDKAKTKAASDKAKKAVQDAKNKAAELNLRARELIAGVKGDKSAKAEKARLRAAELKAKATALLEGLKAKEPVVAQKPAPVVAEKPKASAKRKAAQPAEPKPKKAATPRKASKAKADDFTAGPANSEGLPSKAERQADPETSTPVDPLTA